MRFPTKGFENRISSRLMSQASLERKLGVTSSTALVISNMIGVGIFTTTGHLAGDLGSPLLVLGVWLIGAVIALVGALCYSELSINFPRAGGEYVYLSEAWGSVWGFVSGWVSFFAGFSAPIAAGTLAISAYLSYFSSSLAEARTDPLLIQLGFISLEFGSAQLIACGIVIFFTCLNILGVAQIAALQNLLTMVKIVVLGSFLILGFTVGAGNWSHFTSWTTRSSSYSLGMQFAISLVFVYVGYSGWNAAVYVAEEIRKPRRTLPKALIFGTVLVAIFYILLNTLYIFATPLENMKGVVAVGAKSSMALFGPRTAGFFSAGMAVSLLSTVNAMCMIGPRVYYAMALRGAFFASATKIHRKWKSPWVAVLWQGLCCCLLVLTGTFQSLIYYIGFTLNLFSAFSVLALLKFRKRPDWQHIELVSFAYPLLPTLYIAISLWTFLNFAPGRLSETAWSLATIVGGAIIYYLFHQEKGSALTSFGGGILKSLGPKRRKNE